MCVPNPSRAGPLPMPTLPMRLSPTILQGPSMPPQPSPTTTPHLLVRWVPASGPYPPRAAAPFPSPSYRHEPALHPPPYPPPHQPLTGLPFSPHVCTRCPCLHKVPPIQVSLGGLHGKGGALQHAPTLRVCVRVRMCLGVCVCLFVCVSVCLSVCVSPIERAYLHQSMQPCQLYKKGIRRATVCAHTVRMRTERGDD